MIIRAKYGSHAAIQDSNAHSRQLRLAHHQQGGQQEQQQPQEQHQQQHDLHPNHPPQQQPQAAPPAGKLHMYTASLTLYETSSGAVELVCYKLPKPAMCRLHLVQPGMEHLNNLASCLSMLVEVLDSLCAW